MEEKVIDTSGSLILIVDDTPANVAMLGQLLSAEGYRIAFANSGCQGLTIAAKTHPALILLDVMMPEMDGFETCQRLRDQEATRDIPVIFVTAKTSLEDVVRGFQSGAVDYIPKPIKREEVCARVKTHVQLSTSLKVLEQRSEALRESNARLRHEIVERKQAQQELRTAKEVATAVVHNIGNLINSINVSTQTILDRIGDSRLDHLARICQMLSAHEHDLGAYLQSDPRGRLVPSFLEELFHSLDRDRQTIGDEVGSLKQQIDMIREISLAQQTYASVGMQEQEIEIGQLIEDAIRLQIGFGVGKTIKIERDYSGIQVHGVPKTRMAHVLMNLVKNAREALMHNPEDDRRLTFTLGETDDHGLELRIQDNGHGISTTHMQKIFTYGFTTKKEGHGFGLNYCARVLEEMGGSLTAESDGEGRGATFIVRLPPKGGEQPDPAMELASSGS